MAERSEVKKIKGKTYITNGIMGKYVRRQKKAAGSNCDNRKTCGTSDGNVSRKERFRR